MAAREGALFAFARTYAVGEVAREHYATEPGTAPRPLVETYVEALGQGQQFYASHAAQIEEQARALDSHRLLQFVRSQ